jgi:hypothetical protein
MRCWITFCMGSLAYKTGLKRQEALVLTNRTPILPWKSAQQYCPINDNEYRTAIK